MVQSLSLLQEFVPIVHVKFWQVSTAQSVSPLQGPELTLHMKPWQVSTSQSVSSSQGEEFIRWEPHLYSGDKKGRGSIRERVKNWAEHIIFIGYDVFVEDGKGREFLFWDLRRFFFPSMKFSHIHLITFDVINRIM